MNGLITDIRQLRRRPVKNQNNGTIPISFDGPVQTAQNLVTGRSQNGIPGSEPETVHAVITSDLNVVEDYITEDAEGWERVDELTAVLRRMQRKNPYLDSLIDSLDLAPVELDQPAGNARLWELAGKALAPGRIYSRLDAIELIRTGTGVSQDRAELGFKLMLESKAIEQTVNAETAQLHPDRFYLGGSTPY